MAKLNLLTQEQLESPYCFSDYQPILYFSNLGLFNEDDAIEKVSKALRIQRISLEKCDIENAQKLLNSDQLKLEAPDLWRKHRLLPLSLWQQEILVCAANPLELEVIKKIEFQLQRKIKLCAAPEQQILNAFLAGSSDSDGLDFKALLRSAQKGPELKAVKVEKSFESNIAAEDISAPTVIKIVNRVFAGAIQKKASDLHISPEQNKLVVRIRVDGIMRSFLEIPEAYKDPVIARIKVLCGMDISEKRNAQDGRLRLKTNYGNRDLRISTVPTIHGENIVARILDSELANKTFESLGMNEVLVAHISKALSVAAKVILTSGPTGSGKTSSLYAALLNLHTGKNSLVTIEDPIEYRLEGINQIQINTKAGMTFPSALRSILRQDPDVIMLGEIRDSETAAAAMQAAQTGHLVLSSIHTNSAASTITRLRDLGIPPFLIASSLGSVISQRLVRRLCGTCAIPAESQVADKMRKLSAGAGRFMQAVGCDECDQTGYKGRIGVYSVLTVTPEVAAAIREEKGELELEKLAKSAGFESLESAALGLAAQGLTTLEEVERILGTLDCRDDLLVAQEPQTETELSLSKVETPGVLRKPKLLIVDDDENIRAIYQMILEYEMFEVETAENGHQALNKIFESPPELVVLDLMMPKMNGFEMIEKLRANPSTKNLPVLVLTAAANDENELELIKKGADDFVSKTSRSEIIVARINRLLNR